MPPSHAHQRKASSFYKPSFTGFSVLIIAASFLSSLVLLTAFQLHQDKGTNSPGQRESSVRSCDAVTDSILAAQSVDSGSSFLKPQLWNKGLSKPAGGICFLTGDIFGATGMAGTATAFWLLANTLIYNFNPKPRVTFIGVNVPVQNANCTQLQPLYQSHGMELHCPHTYRKSSWENNWYRRAGMAALYWLRSQPPGTCSILHVHEWGGLARPVVMASLLGEFPGMHIAVAPHGGYMWARQSVEGPRGTQFLDVEADDDERFVLENADSVVAPSLHMVDFLRQRGWRLCPATTSVIGNVQLDSTKGPLRRIAFDSSSLDKVDYKPVQTLVFYGRLEERKGLHIFLDAVDRLVSEGRQFRVALIGGDPTGEASGYIKARSASWGRSLKLFTGLNKDHALPTLINLTQPLVVCPSQTENQPYVVAEIALAGLAMVSFDVGGTRGMLTIPTARETLVEPTLDDLVVRIRRGLDEKRGAVPVLRDEVINSWESWLEWHRKTFFQLSYAAQGVTPQDLISKQRSIGLPKQSTLLPDGIRLKVRDRVALVDARNFESSVLMREKLCGPLLTSYGTDSIAFVHPDLTVKHGWDIETVLDPLRTALFNGEHRNGRFLGITTGIRIEGSVASSSVWPPNPYDFPTQEEAYPSGPTWIPRVGDGYVCVKEMPLLVKRDAFCLHFSAEAQTFRDFRPWLLAILLELGSQEASAIATYQRPLFSIRNTSSLITSCDETHNFLTDELPPKMALNLRSEALLRARLAKAMKVVEVSFTNDFSPFQDHRGWRYAFAGGDNETQLLNAPLHQLVWLPGAASPHFQGVAGSSGIWSCNTSQSPYPQIGPQWMHPCKSWGSEPICCGYTHAAPALVYTSNLQLPSAKIELHIKYFGNCGDGVRVVLDFKHHRKEDGKTVERLGNWVLNRESRSNLIRYSTKMGLRVQDEFRLRVLPLASMDCDGLQLDLTITDLQTGVHYINSRFSQA